MTEPQANVTSIGKFRYHGSGGDLFGMVIVNAIFTILTLGIYSFWARNKVRQFHYSHTELDGDRFAYHGTGGELLRGALVAGAVSFVLALGLTLAMDAVGSDNVETGLDRAPLATGVVIVAFYVILIPLVIYAVNASRRYRLSRSSWRGIRFSFHGRFNDFGALILRGVLLTIVTLGLYTPFFQNDRRRFLVNNARFGSEPFMYIGEGRTLFYPFLKALLLTPFTFGFSWIWYSAFRHRHFWNNTRMRGAMFRSSVTGWSLLELQMTNLVLIYLTLGIGATWAIVRSHAYFAEKVTLEGTVDWARIQQQAQNATAMGEEMAEGFDVDVGI
jgi:uncharacterized membrane protein YjgN (DUF898 family)